MLLLHLRRSIVVHRRRRTGDVSLVVLLVGIGRWDGLVLILLRVVLRRVEGRAVRVDIWIVCCLRWRIVRVLVVVLSSPPPIWRHALPCRQMAPIHRHAGVEVAAAKADRPRAARGRRSRSRTATAIFRADFNGRSTLSTRSDVQSHPQMSAGHGA